MLIKLKLLKHVCSTVAKTNQVSVQLALRASFIFESAPPALLVWLKAYSCREGPICSFIQYVQFYKHLLRISVLNPIWYYWIYLIVECIQESWMGLKNWILFNKTEKYWKVKCEAWLMDWVIDWTQKLSIISNIV